MSKSVKKVAKIALPIAGAIVGGPVGAAIGGAVGGAVGGGGLGGAVLGATTGYIGASAIPGLVGTAAGTPLSTVTGNAALQGPTAGSGLLGAVTGGGTRALASGVSQAATSGFSPAARLGLGLGNQLIAEDQREAAEDAANIQARAIDRATQSNQAAQQQQQETLQPFVDLGTNAAGRIEEIQSDRAGYIQNNPLYNVLAQDAQRRLLNSQSARGRSRSGGTQAALQDRLMITGNSLVNQELNNLQGQVNTGANAAAGVGQGQLSTGVNNANLNVQRGNVLGAGEVGQSNAISSGYQNSINTLLALQGLNRTQTYSPQLLNL